MGEFVVAGERIGDRYTLEHEIARGGMAVVFAARDDRHGRTVALKFLRPELFASLGFERFKREIGIAANLSHPHIVPLYDSGESRGRLYYVMPFVEGPTLRAALKADGRFKPDRALSVIGDVAEALAYAHEHGLVHRDIKPSNIILTANHAVVTDFGVAAVLDDAGPTITTAGGVIGTPGYMAPEQATDDVDVDARADVYSLGCVAYEMLAGEPPFKSKTAQGRLAHQLSIGAVPLSTANPDLPHFLTEAVQTAMSTEPQDRFTTVADFVEALTPSGDGVSTPNRSAGRPWTSALGRHAALWLVGAVVVLGAGVYFGYPRAPITESWPDGRPGSVVVLPMTTSTSSDEEREVAVAVSEDVTAELALWNAVRAVPSVSLTGPMFDRGIEGASVARLEDAMALGRDLRVAAVVTVTAEVRGDSARVQAALFDVTSDSRRPVGPTVDVQDHLANPLALAEPIARRILGLEDQPFSSLEAERRRSREPQALAQEDEGSRHLAGWRLAEAETAFRRAIELDSTFGFAHHRLAQTLYWQYSEQPSTAAETLAEVARHSAAAVRSLGDLGATDQAHVRAFHAFQEGDYTAAREGYGSILSRDSTDVYAWLLLGSVEFRDPWLRGLGPEAAPRGNWNQAVRAFTRAVELQPSFELGYGHLFDIYEAAVGTLDPGGGRCQGFMIPRGVNIPPWERRTPDDQLIYCLATPDTIAWLPMEAMRTTDRSVMRPAAEELRAQATRLLVRWSLYAPGLSKPLEELAGVTLRERARLDPGPPQVLDSLARQALEYRRGALALATDTLPTDLFDLAGLYLAIGDPERALSTTEEGLRLHEAQGSGGRVPAQAVNAFLATGQVSRALAVLPPPLTERFEPDPNGSRFVPWGGALEPFQRATLLGGSMVGGAPLRSELDRISALWQSPGYSEADRELLRVRVSPSLAVALAFDDVALREWGDVPALEDPLWRALIAVLRNDVDAASMVQAAAQAPSLRLSEMSQNFVTAALALRIGRPDTALQLLASIDSVPLRSDRLEARWGIYTSSLLLQGDAYVARGDTSNAAGAYERFLGWWTGDDPLTEEVLLRARRISRGPAR